MNEIKHFVIQLSALSIIIIGVIGLIGNLTLNPDMTHWGGTYGIAVPTSIAFMLIGANLMLHHGNCD